MNIQNILKIMLMTIIYFIAGELSFLISQDNSIVSITIFAAEGFALAAVLIYGRVVIPGIFLGQLILALYNDLAIAPAVLISTINSFEAFIALTLFNRFNLDKSLNTLKDILGLIVLIAFALQLFSSLFGNIVLYSFSIVQSADLVKSIFSWWFGNTMGQILMTPFLLYLYKNKSSLLELFIHSLFFMFLSFVLIVSLEIKYVALLISVTLPLMIIVSSKKSLDFATLSIVVISSVALFSHHMSIGLFSTEDKLSDVIRLNFFILLHILLVLIIGVLFKEKDEAMYLLKRAAFYDHLTGLPNRNILEEIISTTIARAIRYDERSAICFIDLDGFKKVNDTLGHEAGDVVLVTVSSRIKNLIRQEDSLIRLGGDEFLLILSHIGDTHSIDNKLKEILKTASIPIKINNQVAQISLSVGISICPDNSTNMNFLIQQADGAMYEAKNKGKNCFVMVDEKVDT